MPNFISEDTIEQAILKRLQQQFGFELLNCYTSDAADLNDRSGRGDKREVIFAERLKEAAKRLNTDIPESAVDEALTKLTDRRYAMSAIAANREIDGLIRDGIPVEFENAQGKKEQEMIAWKLSPKISSITFRDAAISARGWLFRWINLPP